MVGFFIYLYNFLRKLKVIKEIEVWSGDMIFLGFSCNFRFWVEVNYQSFFGFQVRCLEGYGKVSQVV